MIDMLRMNTFLPFYYDLGIAGSWVTCKDTLWLCVHNVLNSIECIKCHKWVAIIQKSILHKLWIWDNWFSHSIFTNFKVAYSLLKYVYDYKEKTLEKIIRMEVRMEKTFKEYKHQFYFLRETPIVWFLKTSDQLDGAFIVWFSI